MNHRFLRERDVDLIDIDPFMTELARTHPLMLELNRYVPSPNYRIHNLDANVFLERNADRLRDYRYVVVDFPVMISPIPDETKRFGLEKFFSRESFVDILLENLPDDGLVTMQADDTVVHAEHEAYFRSLIAGSGIIFRSYELRFENTDLSQYFYLFAKNESVVREFMVNASIRTVRPGLFRKDDYFTDLFESLEKKEISYDTYLHTLSGK